LNAQTGTKAELGMRRRSWIARVLLAVLVGCWTAFALAQVPVPKLSARVTDLTATLSAEQRQALETRLAEFEKSKGAQIAVLIVPSTQPEPVEQYARRVLDEWKLGRKGIDDGALLLIAMKDRKLRIEVQYGLEGVLPDATAKRIIDETVVPRFKSQDFYGGISAGVERMIGVVSGEALPPPPARGVGDAGSGMDGSKIESLLMMGFALVFVVGAVLRSILGRFPGALVSGGIGGVAAWFIVGSAVAAGIVALIVFFLTGVIGLAGTSAMSRGRSGGSWGGGSWGGGGGWSGGGGGWSGGGGSGGGGGASGGW